MQKILLSLIVLSFFQLSCKKELLEFERPAFLYSTYSNSVGQGPILKMDAVSNAVQLDTAKVSTEIENNRIKIRYNNIIFQDGFGLYDVEDIFAQELVDGEWKKDIENNYIIERSKKIDVVLVLDLSYSVDKEIQEIRKDAKIFAKDFFSKVTEGRIGVVAFGENINYYTLDNNLKIVESKIDNIQITGNKGSKVYEAVDKGIDILQGDASRNRAIVVFTDGNNNAQSDLRYENNQYIINRIKTINDNLKPEEYPIKTFTIGYQGQDEVALNESSLIDIANAGNGEFILSESLTKVKNAFTSVASKATCIFNLCYDRNNSPTSTPVKFRVVTKLQLQ